VSEEGRRPGGQREACLQCQVVQFSAILQLLPACVRLFLLTSNKRSNSTKSSIERQNMLILDRIHCMKANSSRQMCIRRQWSCYRSPWEAFSPMRPRRRRLDCVGFW